ncbi:fasciclin domain-containing protein [Nonlabens sp. SCSIO 43208]|uniref:fasciclin domain-containing protein n=1 Tax=Nonlabens sp. SCSIO 43208 TaxID=2793009 RepID=UPI003D6BC1F6
MKNSSILLTAAMMFTAIFATAQCNNHQASTSNNDHATSNVVYVQNWHYNQTPDIVGVAMSDKNFATLVAAVKAADLVKTLQGDGPFTVFAPTNAAFDKLPEGTVANLLKPENKAKLQAVLTYHVLAGKVTASDIIESIKRNGGGFMTKTVQGDPIYASIVDGKVVLEDAQGRTSTITATDIEASNGVVHIIDTVVLPE